MKTLINIFAGGGLLIWSLICWLGYAFADGMEDWLAAHATWLAGDVMLGGLIQTMLNAGQGLGLILTVIVWAVGAVLILVPTFLLNKLFGKRRKFAPASAAPAPSLQHAAPVFHATRHVAQSNMISRVMGAAKKYR
jgi:hypothetical protein